MAAGFSFLGPPPSSSPPWRGVGSSKMFGFLSQVILFPPLVARLFPPRPPPCGVGQKKQGRRGSTLACLLVWLRIGFGGPRRDVPPPQLPRLAVNGSRE